MSFVPSGVITLTTDFARKSVFVGAMNGQMLRRFPAVTLVDLTHDTPAHWPDEAGSWLSAPAGRSAAGRLGPGRGAPVIVT